jgi:hypothetical protein
MRTTLTALLIVALCARAGAQSRGDRNRSNDEVWRPSIGLPLPQIGLPLPPIGLPLPRTGLPPERSEHLQPRERSERQDRHRARGAATVFVGPFGWSYPYWPEEPFVSSLMSSRPLNPPRAIGTLRVELRSGVDPQIFIDGYYVGLYSDAPGGELTVDAGAHTIELHEDGYDPLHAEIRVPEDATVTYVAELKWIAPLPARLVEDPRPSSPPPAPTTIYVIPGCYVGNVPPRDVLLPAGCDAAKAVVLPPAR